GQPPPPPVRTPSPTDFGPTSLEGGGPAELKRALMRKVAQLTKVVVHLNARNDEAELRYDRLRASFEDDIRTIVKDASSKIDSDCGKLDGTTGFNFHLQE
ncbi:unnamed protein product, partial [Polarella glacialis]